MDKRGTRIAIVVIIVLGTAGFMIYGSSKTKNTSTTTDTLPTTTQTTTMNDSVTELKVAVVKEGAGAVSKSGDTVSVDYTGMFTDGKVFDSSIGWAPFELTLGAGQVIRGWEQGLLGMKIGEKRNLTIPPELAYGKNGFPGAIPPNATLIFEVELKAIK